jgi:hypothetical protein
MSNAPHPDDERGRVVPFRSGKPRNAPVRSGSPVEGVEQYAQEDAPDNYRQRMINNGLALTFCVLLVVAGVWLANTIAQMRQNQDCVLSGRRNCAQVNVPPASPN